MMTAENFDISFLLDNHFSYVMVAANGTILNISNEAQKLFSLPAEKLIGIQVQQYFGEPWSSLIQQALERVLETGVLTDDMWIVDNKGKIKRFIFRYRYIKDINSILIVWFEIKDRLNRLLQNYDKNRKRFLLWNGTYITTRELRTIAYYIQGLSYKAIAKQEHISHAAVSARLQSIAQKTGYDSVPALHTALFDELYRDSHLPQLFDIQ